MIFYILTTIAVVLLSISDIILTNKTIKLYEENKDKLNLLSEKKEDIECNNLVKFCWKKFGLKKTKILFLIVSPIIIISMLGLNYFFDKEYYQFVSGIVLGGYLIVNWIHLQNLDFLYNKIKAYPI